MSADGCVISIDAGTTGVRSLVVDAQCRVTDVAYRELPQHFPRPGWVEHDPLDIWHAVVATLEEVADRLGDPHVDVAAIGITNQRETALAWDRRDGRPLHHAIVWQDRRTAARCEELREAGCLPVVRERTGLVLDSYFSATKWEWLLRNALEPAASQAPWLALGTVDAWVLWNLTGGARGHGVFATDASNASRTLLLDTARLHWSDELCELFGVPMGALPEVRPSAGRLGTIDAEAFGGSATAAGRVLAGVPVSGIAGDQQAALFGQACFEPGMVKVTYGTGSFVLANAGAAPPPPPDGLVATVAWDLGTAVPGSPATAPPIAYALEGSTFVSGAAIQWLRDALGIIDRAEELGPLAASVPDSGGVTFVPAFTGLGSPWWDPDARGTVLGITRGAGRAQLARAVVEAIAFQVRDMVDAMSAASGQSCSLLRADGGASAMDLLLQLQADQLQTTVARPRSVESTALGAAMLAGLAEGFWGGLDDLENRWTLDAEFTPQIDPAIADAVYTAWLRGVERSRCWAKS